MSLNKASHVSQSGFTLGRNGNQWKSAPLMFRSTVFINHLSVFTDGVKKRLQSENVHNYLICLIFNLLPCFARFLLQKEIVRQLLHALLYAVKKSNNIVGRRWKVLRGYTHCFNFTTSTTTAAAAEQSTNNINNNSSTTLLSALTL